MGDKQKAPRDRFSLDEILAEARTLDQAEKEPAPAKAKEKTVQKKVPVTPEEIAAKAKSALDAQIASQPSPPSQEEDSPGPSKKKKGRRGLFGRRKREIPDLDIENDIYYGLQLKSIEEYREDYEKAMQATAARPKSAPGSSVFSYLFEETPDDAVDDEIAERFEKLHNDRKKRVQSIMKKADLEQEDLYSSSDFTVPEAKEPDKPEEAEPSAAIPPAPQQVPPEPIPEPKQDPVPTPAPGPEINPAPSVIPEITEPYPAPMTPPTPLQPEIVPPIRGRMSEEPVKEPVHEPKVKEELPNAPAVEEPVRPVPQTVKRPVYRAFGPPVHILSLDNMEEILSHAAKRLPPVNPKPAPPPIPLPVVDAGEPEAHAAEPESAPESEPDGIPLAPEEQDEEQSPEQPIPFPEPAAMEPEPEEEEEMQKPVKKRRFHLFGNEEEDNDSSDDLPDEQEELDDYISPDDAASVLNELKGTMHRLLLRFAVTGISLLLLLGFGLLREISAFLPPELLLWLTPQAYLIVNLVFLLIAGAFCAVPIANGLKALLTFQANADSAVAVATIAAAAQNIALLFSANDVQAGNYHVYSVLVVLALFFNTFGKTVMTKRILRNFRFVSAPDQKQAVLLFDDYNTALQMADGCVIDSPVIAYQTKTKFLKNFLRLSYEPDPSEQASQTMAPIGFVLSLILCIVSVILYKDVFSALTAFAAAACICVPFVNMLSVNLPVNRVCHVASRCGAMAVGYSAIDYFSSVNAVMVDAKDLFPKGTVVLNAIKTFGGQRIDDAIVDATALMCCVGGPLSDVFEQIIKSSGLLPKIDNPVFEDDKGVTGWVSGRRILVGNRKLMEAHSIQPPSRDYEEKYIHTGRKIIYLASGGELVAMFVVSYNSDRRRAMELRRMEDNGISLIVRTCDPNITPRMLAECFGLDEHSIRVLPERLGSVYTKLTAEPQERSPAMLATKGRPAAMMRMLSACVRQRSNISMAVAMQTVAVILGFLLVSFLTCYSGFGQLSVTALLIYELFWAAAILFVPKLRKP
ncbi:MAG: Copper-transporting P-type ATPase [Eubacteriales bacterium]|jgi:hypothetical protein